MLSAKNLFILLPNLEERACVLSVLSGAGLEVGVLLSFGL